MFVRSCLQNASRGREQHIADQLDTITDTPAVQGQLEMVYYRAQRRAEARMKRRFPRLLTCAMEVQEDQSCSDHVTLGRGSRTLRGACALSFRK